MMARIRNVNLSEQQTEELIRQLTDFPDDCIVAYGKECMPGGFTKPLIIRQRFETMVRSSAPLTGRFVALLACFLDARETVRALTPFAIRETFADYALSIGQERMVLALLVDERDEVHRFGAEQAQIPNKQATAAERKAAVERLCEYAEYRLLAPVGLRIQPPDGPETNAEEEGEANNSASADELNELKDKNDKLEQTVSRLRKEMEEQRQRHRTKLDEQSRKWTEERAKLTAERDASRTESLRNVNRITELESELADCKGNIKAAVEEGVREQTCIAVRKWLAQPTETEAAVRSTGACDDILDKAEHLLEQQARMDLHTGNRLRLQKKLMALQDMSERIGGALVNAIHPLPDLRTALREIQVEIGSVQKVLSGNSPHSPLATQVSAIINGTQTWEELRHCDHLIEQLTDFSMLESRDTRVLYDALHRKSSLLEERSRNRSPEQDTGWSLRGVIYKDQNAILLIDGHNVLFTLKDLFEAYFEDGVPRRKARQRLIYFVAKLLHGKTNIGARIFFDAPESGSEVVAQNVTVEFSGGTGEHRADRAILERLKVKDLAQIDSKMFVITDDREVRKEIRAAGARYVPNNIFAVLLADFGCLK